MKQISLILMLCCCITTIYSQNISSSIIEKRKIEMNGLSGFAVDDAGKMYILSKGELYEIPKNKNEKTKRTIGYNDISGITFNKKTNRLLKIDKTGIVTDMENNKIVDFSTTYVIKSKQMQPVFLANNDQNYFTCFMSPKGRTLAESIVIIEKNGELKRLAYISGNPSGLYCNEDYLYYLTDNGTLRKYNLKSNKCEMTTELPLKDTYGLVCENDILYTYCTKTNEIVKIKLTSNK